MADIKRCPEPDDPHRCQSVTSQGQCNNLATCTEDGEYGEHCLAHGGNQFLQSVKIQATRNYRLDKFKVLLARHATSPAIKGLRDEIAILRMTLEERLNRCEDANDLIMQSGPISDMVMKIDKVVGSCHKLEGSMGQLLDKTAILQFASEVIEVISAEVNDELAIEKIGNKIMAIVGRLGNEESENYEGI